jgi:glycosyltransferase involved in cell wall biosynthesis
MPSAHPGIRGPIPKHTPLLAEALASLGCEVVIEPWGRHHDQESLIDKVAARSLDIARVRRRLRSERFDVMVVQTSHDGRSLVRDVPLLAATRALVPKIVLQFHGSRSDLLVAPGKRAFKAATAALFRLSDGVLVLSSEEASEAQQFWPRGCFRVVVNPFIPWGEVDPVLSKSSPERDGSPSLLFVGRLIAEKGIFELLAAFAQLIERRPCRLVMVGDGAAAAELARRVSELGLDASVSLTGFLSGERLLDAYRSADVFVLPSYREGFPTAIIEAMAAGLPIVTTGAQGMADHLADGHNALLVAPRDAHALAAALERILSDGELRGRMSVANTAKLGEFAPQAVASEYLLALREISGRGLRTAR